MGTTILDARGGRALWCAAALIALLLSRAHAQDPTAEVLRLVNQARVRHGLAPIARAAELDVAAERHSRDMAINGFFSHTGSDGSNAGQRANAAGYFWYAWGENIAAGFPTAAAVMEAWMNSPGHRANILQPIFQEIGIAVVQQAGSRYGVYWTQVFGARVGGAVPSMPAPPPPPFLQVVSPVRGTAGTKVTLLGRRFQNTPGKVTFNGAEAAVIGWSDTRIQVIVPAGATTGPVQVTTGAGASNTRDFTVIVPQTGIGTGAGPESGTGSIGEGSQGTTFSGLPRLLTATPTAGPFTGTMVTLHGANLGDTPGVVFFSGQTTIVSWSNREVTLLLAAPRPGQRYVRLRRADGRASNALLLDLR